MKTISSPRAMQCLALRWRREGVHVGFVPTMGCLHEGHLSLVREARRRVGHRGKVVASIYVNPTQFGPKEDFTSYPRALKEDTRLCRAAGVDVLFAPSDTAIYPGRAEGLYSTYVVEESLGRVMEGASRPTHFRGVTTIVAKLFNLVLPEVAVFGAKDWQQATVIRRMARDLNFPITVVVAPTRREPDGLAMSSRNRYLAGPLRSQATVLSAALRQAREEVRGIAGPRDAAALKKRIARVIEQQPDARVDYIEFFNPETLEPLRHVGRGAHMALAVFVGRTRLIDNASL